MRVRVFPVGFSATLCNPASLFVFAISSNPAFVGMNINDLGENIYTIVHFKMFVPNGFINAFLHLIVLHDSLGIFSSKMWTRVSFMVCLYGQVLIQKLNSGLSRKATG